MVRHTPALRATPLREGMRGSGKYGLNRLLTFFLLDIFVSYGTIYQGGMRFSSMKYSRELLQSKGIDTCGLVFPADFPPYDPSLVEVARRLRNESTKAEVYFWKALKNSKISYKFVRQKPILHYIADFYCQELQIAVEIDGSTHDGESAVLRDQKRDRELMLLGIKVVRIDDVFVKRNPYGALQQVFVSVDVPMPPQLQFWATGQERLFPEGFISRRR